MATGKEMKATNHVTEAFTELAPSYSGTMDKELNQFWGISYSRFVEHLVNKAAVKPGEKVLDIATGTAVIPIKLISTSQGQDRVVGLDITPAMLLHGRKAIVSNGATTNIDLVCASAMAMPFAEGIFDVILCGLGTHHMNVPKMLYEAKRLLANSGRIIISDVGATPFWRSLAGRLLIRLLMLEYGFVNGNARSQAELEAFQNVRTASEWSSMLKNLGYVKVRVEEIKPRFPWFPSGLTLQAEIAG
jgi:demethylmenaquinone methyltransferase/2-methoxy-6-polyprenyl-1,4-benzoquinol methylase